MFVSLRRKFSPIEGFRLGDKPQLLHHREVVAHASMIDNFSIAYRIDVDDFNLKVLFSRRDANKQATVDR